MAKTFTHESDPAHGWLLVTLSELIHAGLSESDISPYSHVAADGLTLALEEDLDAQVFLNAWTAKIGVTPKIKSRVVASTRIRNWERFGTKPLDPPCMNQPQDFDQSPQQTEAQVAEEERAAEAQAAQMRDREYHNQA